MRLNIILHNSKVFYLLSMVLLNFTLLQCISYQHDLQDEKKSANYPNFILSEKKTFSPDQKQELIFKNQKEKRYELVKEKVQNSDTGMSNVHITLKSKNGNILWNKTKNENESSSYYIVSNSGIVAETDKSDTSIKWYNTDGDLINTIKYDYFLVPSVKHFNNSSNWAITLLVDNYYFDETENPVEVAASVIITDKNGNIMSNTKLDFPYFRSPIIFSNKCSFYSVCCYGPTNGNGDIEAKSYLVSSKGKIISFVKGSYYTNGSFSEDENLYVTRTRNSEIIDTSSGEVLATFPNSGYSKIANKKFPFIINKSSNRITLYNYKTSEILFEKSFKELRGTSNLQYMYISPDAKLFQFIIKETLYEYKLIENSEGDLTE